MIDCTQNRKHAMMNTWFAFFLSPPYTLSEKPDYPDPKLSYRRSPDCSVE